MRTDTIITKKAIKHVYLRLDADGCLQVSAPTNMPDAEIAAILRQKAHWVDVKRQQLTQQHRPNKPQYNHGEQVMFLGQPVSLDFHAKHTTHYCQQTQQLFVQCPSVDKATNTTHRQNALLRFYRKQLQDIIEPMIAHYEPIMGVRVNEARIKHMKTRWGTCNIAAQRIWINLALIAYPIPCIEQTVVHEMTHLLERGHNARFYGLMTRFMPDWRDARQYMKTQPHLFATI
ncbi:M48 family metallopeptidase [Ostreibacterium oceani]|uniref:DUF45 domain-containing protein n=1 Tax=Ostreibacterium oceani TaxID=2654998 RepID=A0A6N7EXC5_9GAMM|nr:SprT family zinc-dependent metalloprotease [Ostreibacterium oceani]MPV86235.1 DUF45 domain-containing protein [Ostreibacterium oceani]